jgi:glutamyl-tRNA reductase
MHSIRLGVLGINFKTADLALREEIARGALSLGGKRAIFFPHPTVLLSTCNRTEIYFSSSDLAEAHSDLLRYLRVQIKEEFEHRLYSYFGVDCFVHLCRVAAGVDSAIFAETEIQRQVKVAYTKACEGREIPQCLHYGFQKALKIGKLVRNQIDMEKGSPTLYGVLWQLTDWKDKKILLVGNSEINRGLVSFLAHKRINTLALCSTNPSSVFLEQVRAYDRSILQRWQEFDIIVCASKADRYLISGRAEKNCTVFDLSVPRNVDPNVSGAVNLYNIEQIHQRLQKKEERLGEAEKLIYENAIKLVQIYRAKTLRGRELLEMGSHL